MKSQTKALRLILLSLYLLGTTAILYRLFSGWAYDDPFITYRYADNLAHGLGMVYNPGERVLSTTTPLFALLLAALSPLWQDLPHLANFIGALSLPLGGLFLFDLARSWKTPLVGWAGLLLYPTFPLLLSTLGSETPMYLAFCLGAFACYASQRYGWTAACAALAVLARPDGALVPAILGIDFLLRVRRPVPWKAVLIFLGMALPWFIFAWAYFGSPLPATLATKQQQGAMVISQRFAPGLLTVTRDYTAHPQYWVEAFLAILGLFIMAWAARRWALFLSWTALYFIAYSTLGVSRYYWYYAPLVPGWVALVGLGLWGIEGLIRRRTVADGQPQPGGDRGLRRYQPSAVLHMSSLLLLVLIAAAQTGNLLQLRLHPDRRAGIYQAIGSWLNANTPPQARVGALEVGIIGYYAHRRMVDFAGLIQPEVAQQLTQGNNYEDAAGWAVSHYQPEYVVLHDGSFPNLERGSIARSCRPIKHFPGLPYGYSADLSVYACP